MVFGKRCSQLILLNIARSESYLCTKPYLQITLYKDDANNIRSLRMREIITAYRSSILLLLALLIGGAIGIFFPTIAVKLEPIGAIFLNLLFMIIVPLIGISVMSSIASMSDLKKLGKIISLVLLVSVLMAVIAASVMLGMSFLYTPAQGTTIDLAKDFTGGNSDMDFVSMLTTSDFVGLMSKSNILALIIMSVLGGIAIAQAGEKGKKIAELLNCANEVVMNVVSIIMKVAPIGLSAFFASTMASQDTDLISSFASTITLFLVTSTLYFFLGATFYAYLAGGKSTVKTFWSHAITPTMTALGTCSSLGSLPVTIIAARKMGIKEEIVDICLPLLVNVNKGGVAMIATLKIVFIYAVLNLDFTVDVLFMTIIIAVLAALIVGGIPGGAFLGEIFIVTTLKLPLEAIPILVVLGTTTDALSTLINVVHDLNAAQLIDRFMGDKTS